MSSFTTGVKSDAVMPVYQVKMCWWHAIVKIPLASPLVAWVLPESCYKPVHPECLTCRVSKCSGWPGTMWSVPDLLSSYCFFSFKNTQACPWLVWLSALSTGLWTRGLLVPIHNKGTCLGCGPGPQWGNCERQPHTDVSLPLFSFLSPLSKNK